MTETPSPVYLPENTVLRGGKHTYTILRYLGEGLTAIVYLARDEDGNQVAVKVLRSELAALKREGKSSITLDSFWNEPDIIAQLLRAGIRNIPVVEDWQDGVEPYFIAMQFVDGSRYQSMEALTRDEPLEELEALEFARQALDLLSKLHTAANRTYTDMHLENFAWDRNAEGGPKLMVMDWNHVSYPRDLLEQSTDFAQRELKKLGVTSFEQLIDKDLTRFAAYLYQVLTGRAANEAGENAGALQRHAGPAWLKLSRPLRDVLVKALNPNASERFRSAAGFRASIEAVQKMWNLTPVELEDAIDEFKQLLQEAENARPEESERLAGLDRAIVLFDVLRRNKVWDDDIARRYEDRLEKLTSNVSAEWASGKKFFAADQFTEAAARWERVANERGELALWRWLMVARAGEQMRAQFTDSLRKMLTELLQALEGQVMTVLPNRVRNLREAFPNPVKPIDYLLGEGEVLLALEDADKAARSDRVETWPAAARAYREAARWLAGVPYGALLAAEYGWQDLEGKAKDLETHQERQKNLQERQERLRQQLAANFAEGLYTLEQDLKLDTSLLEIGLAYARNPGNPLANRLEVVRICRYANLSKERAAEVTAAFEQLQAEMNQQAVKDALAHRNGEALLEIVSRFSAKKGFRDSALFGATQDLLREHFKLSVEQKRLAFATDLEQALSLLSEEGAETRRQTLSALQEELVAARKKAQEKLTETTEQIRKKDLALSAVRTVGEFLNALTERKQKASPAEYDTLIAEIDAKTRDFTEFFAKIEDEPEYRDNLARLQNARKELTQAREDWQAAKTLCERIDQQIGAVLVQVGKVTPDGYAAAEAGFKEVSAAFQKVDRRWPEHDSKKAKVEALKDILAFVRDHHVVEETARVARLMAEVQKQSAALLDAGSGAVEPYRPDGGLYEGLARPLRDSWEAVRQALNPLYGALKQREPAWRAALPGVTHFLYGLEDVFSRASALGGALTPLSWPSLDFSSAGAGNERNLSAVSVVGSSKPSGGKALSWVTFALGLLTLLGLLAFGVYWLTSNPLEAAASSAAQTAVASIPTAQPAPTLAPTTPPQPTVAPTAAKPTIPPTVAPTVAPTAAPAAAVKWEFDYPADRCVSKDKLFDLPPIKLAKEQGGGWKLVACAENKPLELCYTNSDGSKKHPLLAELTGAAKEEWKALEGVKKAEDKGAFFMIYPDPGTKEAPIKPLAAGDYKLRLTYTGDKAPVVGGMKIVAPYSAIVLNVGNPYNGVPGVVRTEPNGGSNADYFKTPGFPNTGLEVLGWLKDPRPTAPVDYLVCARLKGQRFDNLWVEGPTVRDSTTGNILKQDAVTKEVPELKP